MGGVVRRYIDILTIIINFPYSTCISSFLAAASLLLCSFLKCFFILVYYDISLWHCLLNTTNENAICLYNVAQSPGGGKMLPRTDEGFCWTKAFICYSTSCIG